MRPRQNGQRWLICLTQTQWVNSLRPRQNGRHVTDDIFKRIFFNENVRILIWISLKLVPKGSINNIPALVRIMAWGRPGDKPLSEPMMVRLPMHICITRHQWVNKKRFTYISFELQSTAREREAYLEIKENISKLLRPEQNDHHFANNIFKSIFLNVSIYNCIKS